MDYGLAHTVAPTQDHGLVNGSAKSSDINRMCKDILEDKTLNVEEMMNNLNSLPVPAPTPLTVTPEPGTGVTANGGPHRLPEKVLEMYNMLIGITTELERIKYELAKRNKNFAPASSSGSQPRPGSGDTEESRFSFENLHEQIILGNGANLLNGGISDIRSLRPAELSHAEECGSKTVRNGGGVLSLATPAATPTSNSLSLKLPQRD